MAPCPGTSSHPAPAAGPDFGILLVLGRVQEADEPHVEEGLWGDFSGIPQLFLSWEPGFPAGLWSVSSSSLDSFVLLDTHASVVFWISLVQGCSESCYL